MFNIVSFSIVFVLSILYAHAYADCLVANSATCSSGDVCTINTVCTWTKSTYYFTSLTVNAYTDSGNVKIYSDGDILINAGASIACIGCTAELITGNQLTCKGAISAIGASGAGGPKGRNGFSAGRHDHWYVGCSHDFDDGGTQPYNGGGGGSGGKGGAVKVSGISVDLGQCTVNVAGGPGGPGGPPGDRWCGIGCDGHTHCTGSASSGPNGPAGQGGSISIFHDPTGYQIPGTYIGAVGQATADLAGSCSGDFNAAGGVLGGCCGDSVLKNGNFETAGAWEPKLTPTINPQTLLIPSLNGLVGQIPPSAVTPTVAYSDPILLRKSGKSNITFGGNIYIKTQTISTPFTSGDILIQWGKTPDFSGTVGSDWDSKRITVYKKDEWIYTQGTIEVPSDANFVRVGLSNKHGFAGIGIQTVYFDDVWVQGQGTDVGETISNDQFICAFDGLQYQWEASSNSAFSVVKTNLYSVVSNGNKWNVCNPNSVFNIDAPSFDSTSLPPGTLPTANTTRSGSVVQIGVPSGSSSSTIGSVTPQPGTGTVDQDSFLNKFKTITVQPPTSEYSGSLYADMEIAVYPKEIEYSDTDVIYIEIRNMKSTFTGSYVTNVSGKNITVSKGAQFVPVAHGRVDRRTDGTLGVASDSVLELRLRAQLAQGAHSLNITLCMNAGCSSTQSFMLNNAFTILNQPLTPSGDPTKINPGRFLCNEEGGLKSLLPTTHASVVECCGPNYIHCINSDPSVTRIAGGPTALLKDYYSGSGKNSVFLGGCSAASSSSDCDYYLPDGSDPQFFPITDWNKYQYLEFDIFLSNSNNLNILLSENYDTAKVAAGTILDRPVLAYSTSGTELNVWHHIRIPLTSAIKSKTIRTVKLYANNNDLKDSIPVNQYIQITGDPNQYLMIFGFDRLFLSNGTDDHFCATSFQPYNGASEVGKWVTDLDVDKDACNNVPSYRWTSQLNSYSDGLQTHCCGDDQGYDSSGVLVEETYKDVNGGCWNGIFAQNNTIVPASVP